MSDTSPGPGCTEMSASSSCLIRHLESYGCVPPADARLLRILPNGIPLYEPIVDFGLESGEKNKSSKKRFKMLDSASGSGAADTEAVAETLLEVERRLKRVTGSLDALHHTVEKYCVVMDHEVRATQMRSDPTFRHQDKLILCEKSKANAAHVLSQLRQLFLLTGAASPMTQHTTKQPAVAFVPSITLTTPEEQWKALAVILARRVSLFTRLIAKAAQQVYICKKSISDQQRFLRTVADVSVLWPLQKVPYAPHVFEKGDNYPYRAELRVELLNLPWTCWGYDKPRKWALPGHTSTGALAQEDTLESTSSYTLGHRVPPPFLCWPPLPATPPCAPASAEIYFVLINKQEDHVLKSENVASTDNQLQIQIRWIGDASHCIESNRTLRVRIIPTFSSKNATSYTAVLKPSCSSTSHPVSHSVYQKFLSTFPSLLPKPVGAKGSWLPESTALHRRLQTAQWRLIDRALHLIYQAQAVQLKALLDVASYGTSEASSQAVLILEEIEGFSASSFFSSHQHDVAKDDPTSSCLAAEHQKLNVTVEQWEPYTTCITLRHCGVGHRRSSTATGKQQHNCSEDPAFFVDVEVWVSYEPEDTSLNATTFYSHCQQAWAALNDDQCSATPKERSMMVQFLRRLPVVEALAVCYLRHTFLQAWKNTVHDVPQHVFDLHYTTLCSTQEPQGGKLFLKFLNWLQTYIAFQMLNA